MAYLSDLCCLCLSLCDGCQVHWGKGLGQKNFKEDWQFMDGSVMVPLQAITAKNLREFCDGCTIDIDTAPDLLISDLKKLGYPLYSGTGVEGPPPNASRPAYPGPGGDPFVRGGPGDFGRQNPDSLPHAPAPGAYPGGPPYYGGGPSHPVPEVSAPRIDNFPLGYPPPQPDSHVSPKSVADATPTATAHRLSANTSPAPRSDPRIARPSSPNGREENGADTVVSSCRFL